MTIRIMTIPFDPNKEAFEDEELAKFLLNKRILRLQPEFFQCNGQPYWSVFIEYEPVLSGQDPKEGLNEPQKLLYKRLAEWRKETSEKEGVPVFIIARNNQLVELVKQAPKTNEALRSIQGFGKKKVEKYGREIIDIITNFYDKTSKPRSRSAKESPENGDKNMKIPDTIGTEKDLP